MQNLLIAFLFKTLALLPLPLARGIGAMAGYFCWLFKTETARVTLTNLRHCFPDKNQQELKSLARKSMQAWGISLLEIPIVWGRHPVWVMDRILRVVNQELFDHYRAGGKGLIIIAPHLGNWEVVGLYCATQGELTSLYAPSKMEALNSLIQKSREQSGARLVPTDSRGVAALLKALKNNKMAGILPDQIPARESGDYAPFFGRRALTMTLIHKLLNRSGALALFCYAKRIPGGFELVFQEPTGPLYSSESTPSLTALNQGVEACIIAAPEQYQWEYKRFRRQPHGEKDIYKKSQK